MRGRRAGIAVVTAALAAGGLGSGCGSCGAECPEPRAADRVVFGEVLAVDENAVVRFALDGGDQLDVLVEGPETALFEDVRYRVPLFGSDEGPPTASLPTRCGCGPFITLPDGSELDIADPSIRLRALTAAVVGGAAGIVLLWGLVRWRGGQPL